DFLFRRAGRITNRQPDRNPDGEGADNGRNRILAEEKLSALAGGAGPLLGLLPGVARRYRDLARCLAEPAWGFPGNWFVARLHRGRERIVLHKFVAVWIDHINKS